MVFVEEIGGQIVDPVAMRPSPTKLICSSNPMQITIVSQHK